MCVWGGGEGGLLQSLICTTKRTYIACVLEPNQYHSKAENDIDVALFQALVSSKKESEIRSINFRANGYCTDAVLKCITSSLKNVQVTDKLGW